MSDVLAKCAVCQALLDEEDLFCGNCGTEAPPRPDQKRDVSRTATYNFECSGCGASMSYDALAGQLRCPFCGSEQLVAQPDAKVLSPERVVPFVLTCDQAVSRMRKWLGAGFLASGRSERAGDGREDDRGVRPFLGLSGRDVHALDGRYQSNAAGRQC